MGFSGSQIQTDPLLATTTPAPVGERWLLPDDRARQHQPHDRRCRHEGRQSDWDESLGNDERELIFGAGAFAKCNAKGKQKSPSGPIK